VKSGPNRPQPQTTILVGRMWIAVAEEEVVEEGVAAVVARGAWLGSLETVPVLGSAGALGWPDTPGLLLVPVSSSRDAEPAERKQLFRSCSSCVQAAVRLPERTATHWLEESTAVEELHLAWDWKVQVAESIGSAVVTRSGGRRMAGTVGRASLQGRPEVSTRDGNGCIRSQSTRAGAREEQGGFARPLWERW
jgi:hypothetical protein